MSSYSNIPLNQWNQEQVKEWVDTLELSQLSKIRVKKQMDKYSVAGDMLMEAEGANMLAESLEISMETASILYNALENYLQSHPINNDSENPGTTDHQNAEYADSGNDNGIDINSDNDSDNGELKNDDMDGQFDANRDIPFRPRLMIKKQTKILRTEVKPYVHTVADLMQIIHDEEGLDIEGVALYFRNKPLTNEDYTLAQYNMFYNTNDHLHHIIVVKRVIGGAQQNNDKLDEYNRKINADKLKEYLASIELTKEADSITYDDDENEYRVKLLSCSHNFSAVTMYSYIKTMFKKDDRICRLYCPVPNCHQLLDWNIISIIAGLNDKELSFYSMILEQNNLKEQGLSSCPYCDNMIVKPDRLSENRVYCDCGSPDFCWTCLKPWKGDGLQICNNNDCDTTKLAKIVANCPNKIADKWYLKDQVEVEMPSIRACPNCLELIQHTEHCKHMTCPNQQCKLKFCFFCLGVYNVKDEKWPCGEYSDCCPIAPKQQLK